LSKLTDAKTIEIRDAWNPAWWQGKKGVPPEKRVYDVGHVDELDVKMANTVPTSKEQFERMKLSKRYEDPEFEKAELEKWKDLYQRGLDDGALLDITYPYEGDEGEGDDPNFMVWVPPGIAEEAKRVQKLSPEEREDWIEKGGLVIDGESVRPPIPEKDAREMVRRQKEHAARDVERGREARIAAKEAIYRGMYSPERDHVKYGYMSVGTKNAVLLDSFRSKEDAEKRYEEYRPKQGPLYLKHLPSGNWGVYEEDGTPAKDTLWGVKRV
jgi:hypothetical protein